MENNSLNLKAEKFQQFLADNKIGAFRADKLGDELRTVIFHTEILVHKQGLPVMFITDESIYGMLKIRVAAGAEESVRTKVLSLLNDLNRQYKIFKYSLSAAGEVVLDISLPAAPKDFDPALMLTALDIALQHLESEFPNIMGKIWSDRDKKEIFPDVEGQDVN
jgi:hypothetical protein